MFNARKTQEAALYRAVSVVGGPAVAHAIVHGPEPEPDAAWVLNSMRRLDSAFAPAVVRQVRMQCQCGHAMDEKVALVRRLFEGTPDLEAFANGEDAHNAGLFAEDGQLYLQFGFCPCPMLATVDRLPNKTWCTCTTGYSKVLFEQVFGCEVQVELLQAIKAGDPRCLMRIQPRAPVWPNSPGSGQK